MPPKSATPSPWQMNRATLIQTLEERDITYKPEWTVPELRATLLEVNQAMEADNKQMVGLTRMNIDELKEKCLQQGISLPAKYSRGSLMKLLRESQSPTGEEHVCFGSYKGYKFKEVHEGYLQWRWRRRPTIRTTVPTWLVWPSGRDAAKPELLEPHLGVETRRPMQ